MPLRINPPWRHEPRLIVWCPLMFEQHICLQIGTAAVQHVKMPLWASCLFIKISVSPFACLFSNTHLFFFKRIFRQGILVNQYLDSDVSPARSFMWKSKSRLKLMTRSPPALGFYVRSVSRKWMDRKNIILTYSKATNECIYNAHPLCDHVSNMP